MSASTQQNHISLSARTCWLLILAALVFALLCYPLYQNNVERQTHKEAIKALNKAARLQEQYFETNGVYTDQVKELGLPASGGASSFMSANWQYRIKIELSVRNGKSHYVLTTLPYGEGADQRTVYHLESGGEKSHQLPGQALVSGWGV